VFVYLVYTSHSRCDTVTAATAVSI